MGTSMSQVSTVPELSIIVPALNEEATIGEVLDRLLALPISKEVILVDDGSTDKTPDIAATYGERIVYLRKDADKGKGAAIRTALKVAKGEITIIQDADLEYSPEEIPNLIRPILENRTEVVYGCRFTNGLPKKMALPNKIVNRLLSLAVRILFFRKIVDEATCYKAIRTNRLREMNLVCQRFEFCPEVTAKSIRMGLTILELPISYSPRTKLQGKKIGWKDGIEAFWTLLKHRFSNFRKSNLTGDKS